MPGVINPIATARWLNPNLCLNDVLDVLPIRAQSKKILYFFLYIKILGFCTIASKARSHIEISVCTFERRQLLLQFTNILLNPLLQTAESGVSCNTGF